MSIVRRRVLATLVASCLAVTMPRPAGAQHLPAATWTKVAPETVGYSSARFDALRAWLKTLDTKAVVIVVGGRVIFEYGDVAHASKVASVRKSILSMLYGPYLARGVVDLQKTVADLGLQEAEPFLPFEAQATLQHLLTARSGIYLPSGNADLDAQTPKRGTAFPGTRMQYNNWDFNAAGTAFEKLTGKTIYQALAEDLAGPIGMQDYDPAKQGKVPSPGSVHPEYVMRLSTRDLARVGLLMARDGKWGDRLIVPAEWVRYSTSLITPFARVHPDPLANGGRPDRWGYGAMWWVWEEPTFPGGSAMGPLQGAYSAMGANGQFVTVLPAEDMVIAHTVDFEANGRADVSAMAYDAILAMAITARCTSRDRC